MSKLIYVPLEHIEGRYTVHMDIAIEEYLNKENIEYIKVMPTYETPPLPEGQFLNSAFTSKFKALQIAEISDLIERGVITDGDTLFFSDIWFPGIESIAYMKYFNKMDNLKITGIIHAGSFTDTDFVRDMERWAKNFEDIIFDISDTIYCASNFIKNDIIKKRMIDPNKLVVSGLPVDYTGLEKHKGQTKKDIVIFNGRLCDEKQPWLFNELRDQVSKRLDRDVQFLKTQEMNLSKEEYYSLLGKSKAVVSYALQENFGFGVAEAVYLGCTPVLPNRLVYPELYPDTKLFNRFDESVDMVINALNDYQEQQIVLDTDQVMQTWFGVKDNTGDKI
jgi:glycosyltransferase involved in cell wall biosynthesis